MSGESRLWMGLAGFAVFFLLLTLLSDVLTPFVAAMAIAYFLDPVADRLQRWGCSRLLATALITAGFFLAAAALLLLLFPLLQAQVVSFIGRLPHYLEALRHQAAPLLERLQASLTAEEIERLRAAAGDYAGTAIQWIGGRLRDLWGGGLAFFKLASVVVITPVVTFYLLRDWDRFVGSIDALLPRDLAPAIRAQAAEIDRTLSAFVRGQATVCLILGAYYAVGLSLIGLDFGLLVGLGAGLISFVPYFGMLIGLAIGVGVALVQFSAWGPAALVVAVFAFGQVVEGHFLTPKLVGERVGLHPVWIIFALLAGGALFGFTGVLLAVPAAAVIGVVVRFALERYQRSRLYRGGAGDPR